MPYVENFLSHEVLLQPIPAPPRLQEVNEIADDSCQPNPANVPRIILKPLKDEIRSEVIWLSTVLSQLYRTDIPRYQQPATYPRDREIPRIDYFCDVVVQPILDLFYSIRSSASWPPLTYNCFLVTFHKPRTDSTMILEIEDASSSPEPLPVVMLLTPAVLQGIVASDPHALAEISDMMKRGWTSDSITCVIACDLQNVITLQLQHEMDIGEIIYNHGPIPNLVHARVILASLLISPIIATRYIWWTVGDEFDEDCRIGPLLPPEHTPLLPDNVIFTRYCCHSDFDYPLLHRSKEHWAQFRRWKTHMIETVVSQSVFAGDVLLGTTNRFAQRNPLLQPYYPAILPPRPTMQTFENCHRPDPLRQFSLRLTQSSSFTVRILRELAESQDVTSSRPCRTYVCQLLSIDNHPLSDPTPVLCLKLYDDRFLQFRHFQKWHTAEDLVRNEIAVYQKLDFMQGSLLPYFYGAHLFTMPSGPALYGILMEYVDAPTVSKESVEALSEDEQLQLIQSTRHGVRILQYADISQHDWHEHQILVHRRKDTPNQAVVHCVFIDFALCTQSVTDCDPHQGDDLIESVYSIMGYDTLSHERIAPIYGRREVWDRFSTGPTDYEDIYYRRDEPIISFLGLNKD